MKRRRLLSGGVAALGSAVLWPNATFAGQQLEEPLADAVRSALSRAIAADRAPPELPFASADERQAYQRWHSATDARLQRRLPNAQERADFLPTIWYESRRAGLETSLVLGLIQVESAFRRFAISRVGARGYMQIMPFWARVIGNGDVAQLFVMQTNLRFGCVILRHYLERENGDLFMALGRYNGSRGKAAYPNAVLTAQKNWSSK